MCFALLVGALVVGQTWTSKLVWGYAQQTENDAQAIGLITEIERILREYHRVGNLYLADPDPVVGALGAGLVAELDRSFRDLDGRMVGETEERLLARARAAIDTYLAEHRALEGRHAPLDEMIREVRPYLEDALARIDALRAHDELALQQAQREAERVLRRETLLAGVSIGLLVVGLGVFAAGSRWLVLRPVRELQDTVRRAQGGDLAVRAHGGAARELHDLASTFNEMAETIGNQRQDQLTFLAGVAHDLRDPISALKVGVQALARDPTSCTTDRLQRLDRQLDRLARMVSDLLDATRIEAGQLELQLADIDLREVARAMVDLYAVPSVTLRVPDRPVVVRADALRLEQVVSNLLSNAIKYSPEHAPVEVSVATVDREATVTVSDRGPGIPPEEVPDLFKPFRRRQATGETVPGVGLGLSIVRRIVTAHGGRIETESAPEVGSTFRVRLPLSGAVEAGAPVEAG